MADKKKAILLRIAPELWASLQRWAAAEMRSVNGHIEYLLREAVSKREGRQRNEPATRKAELPSFWQVYPWVRKLMEDLRRLGLVDCADRLERAISFGGSPEVVVANVRANLQELRHWPVELPEEIQRAVRGLLRALGVEPTAEEDREAGQADGDLPPL